MWRVMMTLYFIYIFKVFIIVPGLTDRSLSLLFGEPLDIG